MERHASRGVMGMKRGCLLGIDASACGTRQDVDVCAAVGSDTRNQIVSNLSALCSNLSDVPYCACVTPTYFVR